MFPTSASVVGSKEVSLTPFLSRRIRKQDACKIVCQVAKMINLSDKDIEANCTEAGVEFVEET